MPIHCSYIGRDPNSEFYEGPVVPDQLPKDKPLYGQTVVEENYRETTGKRRENSSRVSFRREVFLAVLQFHIFAFSIVKFICHSYLCFVFLADISVTGLCVEVTYFHRSLSSLGYELVTRASFCEA